MHTWGENDLLLLLRNLQAFFGFLERLWALKSSRFYFFLECKRGVFFLYFFYVCVTSSRAKEHNSFLNPWILGRWNQASLNNTCKNEVKDIVSLLGWVSTKRNGPLIHEFNVKYFCCWKYPIIVTLFSQLSIRPSCFHLVLL
jgi:hypothetical protein